ncbi:hypothetical protein [Pararhizobium mangrovi]|uniref:NADH-ubiquinone dehydrogenase n=1 Tax=Pararhizobium mangrovi TaxID=2590452 RepID=A0A506UCQ2_9HYPH|nr:hypothetical protein [Pararhizobium mangrovi]TPW30449.1 hypothetical protein FJU11_05425 [Pararhizobium mangrovi]
MSTSAFPGANRPETTNEMLAGMDEWTRSVQPMAAMMIQPLAASAMMTAVGIGVAGHMAGLALGTVRAMNGGGQARWFGAMPLPGMETFAPTETGAPASTAGTRKRRTRSNGRDAAPSAENGAPLPPLDPVDALKAATDTAVEAAEETTRTMVREAKTMQDEAAKASQAVVDKPAPKTVETGNTSEAAADGEGMKKPASRKKPDTPDDLKRITGIGPKLEQVLNGIGVWRFDQIEGWSKNEVAWVDDYLQFPGRIARDDWQGQAKTLAAEAR